MLTRTQIDFYRNNGYLVVESVLDQAAVLDPVRREYAALMDDLYAGWLKQERVPPGVSGFDDRLLASYRAGCDWFQPMDISLPGDRIQPDTPMHFGPAVFDMITNARSLGRRAGRAGRTPACGHSQVAGSFAILCLGFDISFQGK
ncbi:hypothetical protein QO034_04080 [Sedimentitalea sp. JM2-8]|uniref:Phytanoyl-CoA dioxygenase (PhyH) n=1 Tax=Sedimentitalea xiamensis TaxID=3050037 RepID=A0ABT7FAZ8_9RHOB|nr:hypothetical protein [Sedimentitalea xiamensis]MDK3072280.1 hypothetical protein [Sedimentitalea xiamensis]